MILNGITWDHPRGYAPLEALRPEIKQRFGIDIIWTRRSLREFGDTPVTELARQFDLLIIDHPHCGQAARDGALLALDSLLRKTEREEISRNAIGPSLPSYQLDGYLWALPIDAAMQSACWRNETPIDFPQTWEDLLKSKISFAIPLCPTDVFCCFLTLCAQHQNPADSNGNFLCHPQLIKILDLLRRIHTRAHPQSIRWNPIQLYEHMLTHTDVDYCPLAFCYHTYADRLRFGPIPGCRHALLGGAGIAISSRCPEPERVAQTAAWLCSGSCQAGPYLQFGGQPAHGDAWKLQQPFFQNLRGTLEQAYLRPRSEGWNRFQEKAGEILHLFLLKKLSPKQAISTLQQYLPAKA